MPGSQDGPLLEDYQRRLRHSAPTPSLLPATTTPHSHRSGCNVAALPDTPDPPARTLRPPSILPAPPPPSPARAPAILPPALPLRRRAAVDSAPLDSRAGSAPRS